MCFCCHGVYVCPSNACAPSAWTFLFWMPFNLCTCCWFFCFSISKSFDSQKLMTSLPLSSIWHCFARSYCCFSFLLRTDCLNWHVLSTMEFIQLNPTVDVGLDVKCHRLRRAHAIKELWIFCRSSKINHASRRAGDINSLEAAHWKCVHLQMQTLRRLDPSSTRHYLPWSLEL